MESTCCSGFWLLSIPPALPSAGFVPTSSFHTHLTKATSSFVFIISQKRGKFQFERSGQHNVLTEKSSTQLNFDLDKSFSKAP